MLAIRLQRLGRTGYPTYRVAVQEARRHPSSGRVVAYVGSYNPHTKETKFDTEKIEFYLGNGAQPTPRVAKLLKESKVKLPDWVKLHEKKNSTTRNAEKLRKNQPSSAQTSEEVSAGKEEPAAEPVAEEAPVEEAVAAPTEE